MTRSEKLYRAGLVYSAECLCEARIVNELMEIPEFPEVRYVCTEKEAICNGREVDMDLYEAPEGELYAVVCW